MKADQIDPTADPVKDSREFVYMGSGIVVIFEKDVFEADPALSAEIPGSYLFQHFLQRIDLLHRHQFAPLLIKGSVKADGQVGLASVQEFQAWLE